MAVENPLEKPVVLFSMNAGAITTILGLGKLTDFESYFNVPFALGCFMIGAVASLFHLYYRQLADDDFAKLVGFVDSTPDEPRPQRRVGAAVLVAVITLVMIGVVVLTGVEARKESTGLRDSVAKIEATARADEIARDVAEKASKEANEAASNVLKGEARLNYLRDVKFGEYRTALRKAAAARARADSVKAGAEKAAKTTSNRLINLTAAGVLLGLIAVPLFLVLVAETPVRALRVENAVRALAGGAALLSLMIFVLGLSVGSVPGITAGLSTGAAAIDDVAEAPPGPAAAVLIAKARDGRDGSDGRNGEIGPRGGDGNDGRQGIPGVPGATIDARVPVVMVYQGPPGKDGVNGLNGLNGLRGADGISGANGLNGNNGLNGANGTNGDKGVAGGTGNPGPAGPVRRCWFGWVACLTNDKNPPSPSLGAAPSTSGLATESGVVKP